MRRVFRSSQYIPVNIIQGDDADKWNEKISDGRHEYVIRQLDQGIDYNTKTEDLPTNYNKYESEDGMHVLAYGKYSSFVGLYKEAKYKYFDSDWSWSGLGAAQIEDAVGVFSHKDVRNYYYMFPLSDYDKNEFSYINLRDNEGLFRVETERMKFGGFRPLVKVNVARGLIYFIEDMDVEPISFEKKGTKVQFMRLNLSQSYMLQ